jgi:hypothetical protein
VKVTKKKSENFQTYIFNSYSVYSVSLCICHCLFVFVHIIPPKSITRRKSKRNCAMIRIYFSFYLFRSISTLALCMLLVFFLFKNTHTSISFYMSLRFFLNGFYFVRAFYFSICYEVSLRQNCRSVYYYLNVLCFIG